LKLYGLLKICSDILSAVDAHTAKHLVEQCLKGDILKGRTTILVSHHTHLCAPAAAHVVVLGDGGVAFSGSRSELELSPLGEQYLGGQEEKEKPKDKKLVKLTNKRLALPGTQSSAASSDVSSSEMDSSSDDDDASLNDERKGPRKLVEEEGRSTGHIAGHVWLAYFQANGHIIFWFLFIFVFVGAEVVDVAETLVLRFVLTLQRAKLTCRYQVLVAYI
jgi:ABC-type proline/glycine betaine transport system ATPase subunit